MTYSNFTMITLLHFNDDISIDKLGIYAASRARLHVRLTEMTSPNTALTMAQERRYFAMPHYWPALRRPCGLPIFSSFRRSITITSAY